MPQPRSCRLPSARPKRPPRASSSASTLSKNEDGRTAETDGYQVYLPKVPMRMYLFTNARYGVEAPFRFDPTRPTSLTEMVPRNELREGGSADLRLPLETESRSISERH